MVLLPVVSWAQCTPPCNEGYACQQAGNGKYWCVAQMPKYKGTDIAKDVCKNGRCTKTTMAKRYF